MTFDVEWDPAALRDLKRLHPDVQRRVLLKVVSARDDPRREFRRLRGTGASRLRVGDFRVIADIDEGRRVIRVHAVAHRKNVYD